MLISMDSIFSEISRLNLKDGKTIEQRLLKLLEELGELSQALLSSELLLLKQGVFSLNYL